MLPDEHKPEGNGRGKCTVEAGEVYVVSLKLPAPLLQVIFQRKAIIKKSLCLSKF
jgi:hypothetical protein